MLCYHTHVEQFEGKLDFVPGPTAQLQLIGTFYNASHDSPLLVSVELPQRRAVPMWLQALAALLPGCSADWDKPRITLDSLRWFDFDQWHVTLPLLGTWDLDHFCGFLPLHIVVHQHDVEFCRVAVQRRQFCTHLQHDEQHSSIVAQAPEHVTSQLRAHVRA